MLFDCKAVTIIYASVGERQTHENRGVAQLGARHVRDVEAASSNLVTPTNRIASEMLSFQHFRGFLYVRTRFLHDLQ